MIRHEARLERFTGGWNPHNLPPNYLNPRELGAGQVMDARNLRFTSGGSLFWDRNQLRIAGPAGVNVKSLVDYTTDEASQLRKPAAPDLCDPHGNVLVPGDERQRCEVWTRVVGYMRPTNCFNAGKQSEWRDRRHFRLREQEAMML